MFYIGIFCPDWDILSILGYFVHIYMFCSTWRYFVIDWDILFQVETFCSRLGYFDRDWDICTMLRHFVLDWDILSILGYFVHIGMF